MILSMTSWENNRKGMIRNDFDEEKVLTDCFFLLLQYDSRQCAIRSLF